MNIDLYKGMSDNQLREHFAKMTRDELLTLAVECGDHLNNLVDQFSDQLRTKCKVS